MNLNLLGWELENHCTSNKEKSEHEGNENAHCNHSNDKLVKISAVALFAPSVMLVHPFFGPFNLFVFDRANINDNFFKLIISAFN